MRRAVIDIRSTLDLIQIVIEEMEPLCKKAGLPINLNFSEESDRFVTSFIDQELLRRSAWAQVKTPFDDMLSCVFPWRKDTRYADIYNLFDIGVDQYLLDNESIRLALKIVKSWDVWSITRFGDNTKWIPDGEGVVKEIPNIRRDIILTSVDDFRVLDWERRRKNGEFKKN